MTALEKMKAWLMTCPYLPEGVTLQVDSTGARPGSVGLYPGGLEELSRREDVLGNVTVTCKLHVTLYQVVCGDPEEEANAARLMAFQSWVQAQCLAGTAPTFGDEPAKEKIWAEKGKLHSVSKTGTCKYAVRITAQFQKQYERS